MTDPNNPTEVGTKPDEILVDPYKNVDDDEKFRINADIPTKLKLRFQAVCPHRGIIQSMVNHFIKAVEDDMDKLNIKFYEPEQYSQFISIIRRRTAPWVAGDGPAQVGSPSTGGTDQTPSRSSDAPENLAAAAPDASSKVGKGSGAKKNTGGKAGGRQRPA